jgi:hypothetical protein
MGNSFLGLVALFFGWMEGNTSLTSDVCLLFGLFLPVPYLHMSLFLLPLRLRYPMVWSVDVDRSAYVLVLFTPDMNERGIFDA